jgi:hypothetical protein
VGPTRVAGVVAGAVGDDAGIAGVVLGQLEDDLHQVGADVGDLGEDAAADAQRRGAERLADREPDEARADELRGRNARMQIMKKSSIATSSRPTLIPERSGIRSVASGLPLRAENAVRELATVLMRMPNQATP